MKSDETTQTTKRCSQMAGKAWAISVYSRSLQCGCGSFYPFSRVDGVLLMRINLKMPFSNLTGAVWTQPQDYTTNPDDHSNHNIDSPGFKSFTVILY